MPTFCNRSGNRGTTLVYDGDVRAIYDATNANARIVDGSNRVSALLDLNMKLQLGSELVTNAADRTFSSDTGFWTKGTGWIIGDGVATHTGTAESNLYHSMLIVGRVYRIQASINNGNVSIYAGSSIYRLNLSGNIDIMLNASSATFFIQASTDGVYVDNISVKEVLGNHLVQTNASYMPILSSASPRYAAFDGTNDIQSKAFALNQPCTIYTIFKQNSFTSGDYLYDGNTAGSLQCSQVTSAGNLSIGSGGTSFNNTSKSTIGTYDIMCNVYNGASSSSKINNLTKATGSVGAVNAGGFVLGSKSTPSDYGNLEVKEIIIRNGADSDLMQSAIMNYLYYKHNITY